MRHLRGLWALAALLLLALPAAAVVESAAEAPLAAEALSEVVVLPEGPDFDGCEDCAVGIWCGEPDALGRPTAAFARLSAAMLTDAPRPDMTALSPVGLHNARYDFIEDGWVYHRCHLIGHRFGGEASPENLIAGTQALNMIYMLPWEDQVAACLRRARVDVLYRVTPRYEGDELVCRSVLLEALSCDGGASLRFAVLCPNRQSGVAIDYATGYTTLADDWEHGGMTAAAREYVVNARTGKFHLPDCEEALATSRRNRQARTCPRGELLAEGLKPCGKCRP